MNYKLAKELKDAGFPQGKLTEKDWLPTGVVFEENGVTKAELRQCYLPTLEELIEACGERFRALLFIGSQMEDGRQWSAHGEYTKNEGSTPTQAAAHLWLALNPPTK